MVDSEYSIKDCKSPKINIGVIMKNLEKSYQKDV